MVFIYLTSCTNRTSIPRDVLPIDSMQNVMKDLVLAGEYATKYVTLDTSIKDKVKANQDLMETVFKIHHISRAEFKHSLSFYESRPDLNKIIFDSLAADANRNKPVLYTPRKQPPIKPTGIPIKTTGIPIRVTDNSIKKAP
jgi:Domain of unknown function (DUF4296)